MNASSDNNAPSLSLLDLATVVALVAALVYTAGWAYAYRYFQFFQVGLLTLEIPTQYHFMYGVWVWWDWWWLVLGYGVLVVVIRLIPPVRKWVDGGVARYGGDLKYLLPVLVLAAFVGVYQMGATTARSAFQDQRDQDFPSYPRVRIWLKLVEGKNDQLQSLATALPEGCHRLLMQHRSKLFLFRVGTGKTAIAVTVVPLGQVQALRVLPLYRRCER